MTSLLPLLIVFDLDYTLWPFYIDTDIVFPFNKVDGELFDDVGGIIKYFPEVPAIFEKLKNANITIAIASRANESENAIQIINAFNWDKYISFKEIYSGNITNHLENIKKKSKIPFDKMIFFDADYLSSRNLQPLGIICVYAWEGMTMKILDDALQKYVSVRKKKEI